MPARSRPPEHLHEQKSLRVRKTAAYYAVLNQDDAFRAALHELYVGLQVAQERQPTAQDGERLRAFAERWRLPGDHGVQDLWESIFEEFAPFDAEDSPRRPPPRITLSTTIGEAKPRVPRWKAGERPKLSVDLEARQLQSGGVAILIQPHVPMEGYYYDPRFMSRQEVRAYADQVAAQVRKSIIGQAEALEREAKAEGWAEIPPWHRDPDQLLRLARRLYRAAVLGWTFERVAKAEDQESDSYVDPKTVRSTVREWAADLKVTVPRRPAGRPRKTH